MTTAGYLISRAAEQPPILSLTVTIVVVRFFGLARPLARYLDRLCSHDLALRALGGIACVSSSASSRSRRPSSRATGAATCSRRMVGDVDALQGLYLRGLGPPLVALVVGAVVRRSRRRVPAGSRGGPRHRAAGRRESPSRRSRGALGRAAGRRQAAARGELTAELVELLRGAPELVVFGREEETLERVSRAEARARAPRPPRRARRRARRRALDPRRRA